MKNLFKSGVLAALLLALTGPALAQTPAANAKPAKVSGTEELDSLRARNAILAEQVKAYEMTNKMAGGTPVPAMDRSAPIAVIPGSGTGNGTRSGAGIGGARVTMVAGQKDHGLVATIHSDSGTVAVRVGDTVPGLGEVKSIESNRVLVKSGKSLTSLPFASEPTNAAIQGAPQQSSPMVNGPQ